jgi:hypothetical protein
MAVVLIEFLLLIMVPVMVVNMKLLVMAVAGVMRRVMLLPPAFGRLTGRPRAAPRQ